MLPRTAEKTREQTGAAELELVIDATGRVICAVGADRMIDVTLLVTGKRTRIQTTAHCVEASVRDGRIGLSGTDDPRAAPRTQEGAGGSAAVGHG